ncbi:YutD family protein [Paenibacillus pini]|uniref:DUF1027 domain-containing protein n=1 Tax=Paenibacillus pini JCM 16418 TaxID=1236976 RepID=W7YJX8_9BACL|nr:hypothetical protein JCM16418_2028 [Paenibacillus pini JCM 16418]
MEAVTGRKAGETQLILIGGKNYEVLKDYRDAWNPEAFRERYSEVLERYDYIIGDWGYSQLRLKGFYRDNHPKANKDTAISSMVDYINEYCNFGCAYFILQKSREPKDKDRKPQLEAEKVKNAAIKQPVVGAVVEPTVEPAVEPAVEPSVEPVVVPKVESAVEPAVEAVAEPVMKRTLNSSKT